MKLSNVTVGADPEVFVATSDGSITSAIGYVVAVSYSLDQ